MRYLLKKLLPSVAVALTVTSTSLPMPARAQTYPIDCAILLCLSGGWPASVPCPRARAEFIRRITPWPVEPPLQIWRCPMGASYESDRLSTNAGRIFKILYRPDSRRPPQSLPVDDLVPADRALQLIQDRADIDISGPEFNFVRSIRVFEIFIDDDRDDGECDRFARVRLGSYGVQGDFSWQRSNRAAVPAAFGTTRSGCSLRARAVFVEWSDYEGNYGFERVDY